MAPTPLEQHIEIWPLSRIVEYARNPRKNDAAVDRMCASIREFGFKIPCLVRSGQSGRGSCMDHAAIGERLSRLGSRFLARTVLPSNESVNVVSFRQPCMNSISRFC